MHASQPIPELPTLESELYLLTADDHPRSVLASLVVDHALLNDGPVYWVDALNHAATDPIAAVAPSPRILDRIHVARGFTPYQHHSIAETLLSETADTTPGLIVVPAVDALYREAMRGIEAEELLARTVAMVARLRREHDCPVLLTVTREDELSDTVTAAVTEEIYCEHTPYGPRFTGDEFETLVYPVGNGVVQTTITYWQSIIEARQPVYASHSDPASIGGSTA